MIETTAAGTFKVRWQDGRGKNQSKTFSLKRDAREFEAEVRRAKQRGGWDREPRWRKTLRAHIGQAEIVHDTINPHGFFVYLLWPLSDDRPLYIGQSAQILTRLGQHMADPSKVSAVARITLVKCETAAEMTALELHLIETYNPPLNVKDNMNGACLACGEPKRGTALYCSTSCRRQSSATTEPVNGSPTLAKISAAHLRALQKRRPQP